MMEIQEKAVYTTADTAQILKLSLITVERKIRRGEIPATKIGRKYRLLGDDILGLFRWKSREKKMEDITFGSYNIGVAVNMNRKELYSDR